MTRKRILFVDDELRILQSLALSMRKLRGEWDTVFVVSADAAMAEMQKAPFDVIVSDMRMPRVDGVELLARVTEQWPSMLRIILSGYADAKEMARAREVAHSVLAKPCELDRLLDAITAPRPS